MAKLVPSAPPVIDPNVQGQQIPAPSQGGPAPFAVVAPSQSKSLKAPKKASAVAKTPSLRGEAWFNENFSGNAADIVQIRRYPSRREGFHCPPCGIPGSNGIVIKGKDGKGEEIAIYEVNKETRELQQTGTIRGFIVGETCLKKYGKVDIKKIVPTGLQQTPPATQSDQPTQEPQQEQVPPVE